MAAGEVVPEAARSLALALSKFERLPHRGQRGNRPEAPNLAAWAAAGEEGPLWRSRGRPSPAREVGALTALEAQAVLAWARGPACAGRGASPASGAARALVGQPV